MKFSLSLFRRFFPSLSVSVSLFRSLSFSSKIEVIILRFISTKLSTEREQWKRKHMHTQRESYYHIRFIAKALKNMQENVLMSLWPVELGSTKSNRINYLLITFYVQRTNHLGGFVRVTIMAENARQENLLWSYTHTETQKCAHIYNSTLLEYSTVWLHFHLLNKRNEQSKKVSHFWCVCK